MNQYGKTENLFTRDPETHRLIEGDFKVPEVALVSPEAWIATEKIDGTNVRIILRKNGAANELEGPYRVELKGRSDRANLPAGLEVNLRTEDADKLWNRLGLPDDVVVTFYGEAFGAGIQKGGMYSPDKRIAVFDLMTSRAHRTGELPQVRKGNDHDLTLQSRVGWSHAWRSYEDLVMASQILGLYRAPLLYADGVTLEEMIEDVRDGFGSQVAKEWLGTGGQAEGIVARTSPYLFDGRGSRIMFKLKTHDLQGIDERRRG